MSFSWVNNNPQKWLYGVFLFVFIPLLTVWGSTNHLEATEATVPITPNLTVLQAVEGRSVYQISEAHERVTFTLLISHALAVMRSAENLVVSVPLQSNSRMQFVAGSVKIAVDHHSPTLDPTADPTVGIALNKYLSEGVLHPGQTVTIDFQVDVTFPTKLDSPNDTWRVTTSSSTAYVYTDATQVHPPLIVSNEVLIVFPPKASLYPIMCPLYPMIEPTHPAVTLVKTIQKDPGTGKVEEGSDVLAASLGDDILCISTIQPTYLLPFDELVFQDPLASGLIYDQSQGVKVSQIKEWGTDEHIEQILYHVDPVAGFLIPKTFLSGFSIGKPIKVVLYTKVNSPSPFSENALYHRSLVRDLRSKQDAIPGVCKEMIDPIETVASNEVTLTILPAAQDPLLVVEERVNNAYRTYIEPGEKVFFSMLLTNYAQAPVMEAVFFKSLAPGFSFVANSFQVNGVKKIPQWNASSSLLTYTSLPPIAKGHPITVSFWAQADSSLKVGEFLSSKAEVAYKNDGVAITVSSNFVMLVVGPSVHLSFVEPFDSTAMEQPCSM